MKYQIVRIGSKRLHVRHCTPLKSTIPAVVLLTTLAVTGCAHKNNVRTHPGDWQSTHAPGAIPTAVVRAMPGASNLGVIVNDELQLGHYAKGEQALRWYMAQHPGNQPAQFMLHQLTVDPEQMLGVASRPYVVQAGDTYGALAARYLGNPNLFLILARYNGSTNPSQLNVGATIRLPTSAPGIAAPADATGAEPDDADQHADVDVPSKTAPTPAPMIETAAAKAARLQTQSVSLLEHGHKAQALARLGEALAVDPRLRQSGAKAVALRKQLLANYHQRAVILYRDQQLDQAIALWNRVLTIDPGYEPAVIYRARALELKRRLKHFPESP